jgi:hypothetical protein
VEAKPIPGSRKDGSPGTAAWPAAWNVSQMTDSVIAGGVLCVVCLCVRLERHHSQRRRNLTSWSEE